MEASHIPWPGPAELGRLVRQAQRADPDAVDLLLRSVRAPLFGFFARRLAADVADDLTQIALIRLGRALEARRVDPERAQSYLATIARNLLRTAYRRQHRDRERYVPIDVADAPDGLPVASPTLATELSAEADDLRLAVRRACTAVLPPELVQVIDGLLCGDTPVEIARRLQLNPTTVRTRLHRARALLRGELKAHLDSERAIDLARPHPRTAGRPRP